MERLTRMWQDLNVTHPMPVRRVRVLLDWVREGDYDRMVGGDYVHRGEEASAKEEAGAASQHYGDRIGEAFAQAGSSISEVGAQLGDVAQPHARLTPVEKPQVRNTSPAGRVTIRGPVLTTRRADSLEDR